MQNNFVFTVTNGKLKKTNINIIQQLEDNTLITGLNDGDILVIESLVNVEEGQAVLVR